MTMNHASLLLILDFGSQYTQLIARRVREMGIYCEIHPCTLSEEHFLSLPVKAIILSGGPSSVFEKNAPIIPDYVFKAKTPILGICYGMQAMVHQLGGQVVVSEHREFGQTKLTLHESLVDWVNNSDENTEECTSLDVWMSHGDKVTTLPEQFSIMASTKNTPIAVIGCTQKHWYGMQFHPEVTHSERGEQLLSHFLFKLCHFSADWSPKAMINQISCDIQENIGNERVLLGLSGGVDSSVLALLLHKIIKDNLVCVFVDTGLLRKNEREDVINMMSQLNIHVEVVDASERFLNALADIECPETKRKCIGRLFIEVFQEKAKELKGISWLAQGTIYPDVIESAAHIDNMASVIKTHHNVGGLPEVLGFKLLEPFRFLFKDEVRKLGELLGLPKAFIQRHPFPGPGLAVRILGKVTSQAIRIVRHADSIFIEELFRSNLYHTVSQAFVVFLPIKSVGVVGDNRQYDYVLSLRAVHTTDFMTAEAAELPWSFLTHVANRIMNEVKNVARITYDISGKPPATIEWE